MKHLKSEEWTGTICKTFGRNRVQETGTRKAENINVSRAAHERSHIKAHERRRTCPRFLKQRWKQIQESLFLD